MTLSDFPKRDTSKCTVGRPHGKGVRIGFPGWGRPDVELDPALPIDMQVADLGLAGGFEAVESRDLLHRLHGDCTLTHGVNGIASLAKPGGTVTLEYLSIWDVVARAGEMLDAKDWVGAQATEKIAFGQPADRTGLLYPQTMLSPQKLSGILDAAGCEGAEVIKGPPDEWACLLPDTVRLDGVDDKVWEASARNFKGGDTLSSDRPVCVLCERVVTKRDHDRRRHSRYCKDHYHEARKICDARARETFSVIIRARRRN